MENLMMNRGIWDGLNWELVFGVNIYNRWLKQNNKVFKEDNLKGDLVMQVLGQVKETTRTETESLLQVSNPI